MRIKGDTLYLRSAPDWWELERDGSKPNTVRILDQDEVREIAGAEIRYVVMENLAGGKTFTREVIGLWNLGGVLGKTLFMVCWRHPDE